MFISFLNKSLKSVPHLKDSMLSILGNNKFEKDFTEKTFVFLLNGNFSSAH